MKRVIASIVVLCMLLINGCMTAPGESLSGDSIQETDHSAELSANESSAADSSVTNSSNADNSEENQQTTEFPLQIEKKWFEGERLGRLCSNQQWIVNRYKFASDSDINWLSFYPKEGEWKDPVWKLMPEEGKLIADVAFGEAWMYWIEVPISPLGFVGDGWTLYAMQYQDESTKRILDTNDLEMQVYPSIAVYRDELYLKFAFDGERDEIVRYSPDAEGRQPVTDLQSEDPGRMTVYGETLIIADHDESNWSALLYNAEGMERIPLPTQQQTERITRLSKAGQWLIYTTVTDRPGTFYAYNIETGEGRVLADQPDSYAAAADRYLLMTYLNQSPLLYDLTEDRYYEIPESELCLKGAGAEFTRYQLAEIDGRILIYETDRTVLPALIVELSVKEDESASVASGQESAGTEVAVNFTKMEVPDMDTIRRYVRGCEAFKDLYAEWDEEYGTSFVTVKGVQYPGILSTEFLSDEEKNVSFRLIHATPSGDGYLKELFAYQDGEVVSVSEEPYEPSAEELIDAPDLTGKDTLYLQNTLVSYYDVNSGVIDSAKSLSPSIVASVYSGLDNLNWQELTLSEEDRSYYSNALYLMGEEPVYFCIGAREDIMADLIQAYTPAGSLAGGVFYQGDMASAYIHPEATQKEAAEFADLLWNRMTCGSYLEYTQWTPEAAGDEIAVDWCYYRNHYGSNGEGLYHNEHVSLMYARVNGRLDLPAGYTDAIPAMPDETYDLVKAEVWGYDDHIVVTDPDILMEIETAIQSAEHKNNSPQTYLICYPLCFERADGVKLYAYPNLYGPSESNQLFQTGEAWYKFPSEHRDLWDMLGYRP